MTRACGSPADGSCLFDTLYSRLLTRSPFMLIGSHSTCILCSATSLPPPLTSSCLPLPHPPPPLDPVLLFLPSFLRTLLLHLLSSLTPPPHSRPTPCHSSILGTPPPPPVFRLTCICCPLTLNPQLLYTPPTTSDPLLHASSSSALGHPQRVQGASGGVGSHAPTARRQRRADPAPRNGLRRGQGSSLERLPQARHWDKVGSDSWTMDLGPWTVEPAVAPTFYDPPPPPTKQSRPSITYTSTYRASPDCPRFPACPLVSPHV